MGLLQDRKFGITGQGKLIAFWLLPVLIILVSGLAEISGETGRVFLRYDRPAVAAGEYWRLVSGHFAHLGVQHLLLNLAGLILVWLLVGRQYTMRQWCLVIAISIAVIDLGFWYLDTNLAWYVGLSGLLHAMLIAGAIPGYRTMPAEAVIICIAVAGKLLYEQVAGPLPGSEETAGGAVVTNAHLYGAAGGLMSAAATWRSVRQDASI